ncbi:MAG: hypothetical protein C5B58_14365 [Acidobacteria bacterium]|nr:MAG: hypothetical protein C5B58_14365 [Acidobacteriota bacterium]
MSQIEKLKAEADELESRQRSLGNPIKHCEALEQVATKHGYSSWRACRASLSDESEGHETTPVMRRYRSAEWNFAIDFPKHWNIFPPVSNNSPFKGRRRLSYCYRLPRAERSGAGDGRLVNSSSSASGNGGLWKFQDRRSIGGRQDYPDARF